MIGSKVLGILLAGVLGASTSAAVLFVGAKQRKGHDYEEGKQLFLSRCSTCHAREAQGQSSLGPSMFGLAERAGSRVAGLGAAEYVVQSLFEPTAFVVPGFPAVMPGQLLTDATDEEIRSLVGYILNLGGETDPDAIEKVKLPARAKAKTVSFQRAEIERGSRIFWQEGRCGTCHAAHADEHDGNVAPRIFHVGLTEAQVRSALHVRPVLTAPPPTVGDTSGVPVASGHSATTTSTASGTGPPGADAPGATLPGASDSTAPGKQADVDASGAKSAAPGGGAYGTGVAQNGAHEGALLKSGPHTIQLVPASSTGAEPAAGGQATDHTVPVPLMLTEADLEALVKVVLLMN